jgi:hypothetical protein
MRWPVKTERLEHSFTLPVAPHADGNPPTSESLSKRRSGYAANIAQRWQFP